MTPEQAKNAIKNKLKHLKQFREEDLPDIVGTEAVNHYTESFANEGFTDQSLVKWKNVKRRDPKSTWYGFAPYNKNRFSTTRATDKILTGDTKELQNSIRYTKQPGIVTIYTDKEYAAVHQFGKPSKIFGKKTFQQTARPFIGKSEKLENKIKQNIQYQLNKITQQPP